MEASGAAALRRVDGGDNDLKIKGVVLTPQVVLYLVKNEFWVWWECLFRWIPCRTGRLVRLIAYRPFLDARRLWIPEYVHIWDPGRLKVPDHVRLGRFSQLTCSGGIEIGDNVMMGPFVTIISTTHAHEPNTAMWSQGLDYGPISIGSDMWIGAGSTIVPGVTIGDGAIIGAGAVVTRDVEPFSIIDGVPARRIGSRERTRAAPHENDSVRPAAPQA